MQIKGNGQGEDLRRDVSSLIRRWPLRVVICLAIIGLSLGIAFVLNLTAPKVAKRPPAKMIPLVRTMTLQPVTHRLVVPAKGVVMPAREIELQVQVSGEIIDRHPQFTEGGLLPEGTLALVIDPTDYQLAVEQKQRTVTDAEYALRLEQGHQDVARREWNLLYGDASAEDAESELALRKPHLEKVKADLAAARAELEQAKINLERTKVKVPFNALVKSKTVDLGSQVSPQDKLAELVGTDAYWVQASLPIDRLKWVTFLVLDDKPGSAARIYYRGGNERSGRVTKLLADLSQEGRMARLLIEVKDPLDLKSGGKPRTALLIGEYVRVEIDGLELKNVYRIPRAALRNDSAVWLVGQDNKLDIRNVDTVWREEDAVVVKDGLKAGDRLIVSELAAPVAGMELQIATANFSEEDDKPAGRVDQINQVGQAEERE